MNGSEPFGFLSSTHWNFLLFPAGIRGRWSGFLRRLLFPAKQYTLFTNSFNELDTLWVHAPMLSRPLPRNELSEQMKNKLIFRCAKPPREEWGLCANGILRLKIVLSGTQCWSAFDAAQSHMRSPPLIWSRAVLQLLLFSIIIIDVKIEMLRLSALHAPHTRRYCNEV